jgi:hypothetical protein
MECFLATAAFIVFVVISAISEQRRRTREINRTFRVYNQPTSTPRIRRGLGDRRFRELKRSFKAFAREVNGQVVTGKFTGSPRVTFKYHGTNCMLSLHDTEMAASNLENEGVRFSTRLTFKVPRNWPLRLEVFPQDETIDAKYLKMYDLEIGTPEFDSRYVVKANDADFTKEFLDEKTRGLIDELYKLPPLVGVVLSLNRERMIVSKPSLIQDPELLGRLSKAATGLFDRIEFFIDRLAGLEVVVGAPSGDELPVCSVCGVDIQERSRVECRRCGTPLHRDCWDYNGKCAVFGCGEERYR